MLIEGVLEVVRAIELGWSVARERMGLGRVRVSVELEW